MIVLDEQLADPRLIRSIRRVRSHAAAPTDRAYLRNNKPQALLAKDSGELGLLRRMPKTIGRASAGCI
jgi:hypothetical protein